MSPPLLASLTLTTSLIVAVPHTAQARSGGSGSPDIIVASASARLSVQAPSTFERNIVSITHDPDTDEAVQDPNALSANAIAISVTAPPVASGGATIVKDASYAVSLGFQRKSAATGTETTTANFYASGVAKDINKSAAISSASSAAGSAPTQDPNGTWVTDYLDADQYVRNLVPQDDAFVTSSNLNVYVRSSAGAL